MIIKCLYKTASFDVNDISKLIKFYPKKKYKCVEKGIDKDGIKWFEVFNSQGSIYATEQQITTLFKIVKKEGK